MKIIEASAKGILVDWGEQMVVFKGEEQDALREMNRHHPECTEEYYNDLYFHEKATSELLDCYKIAGKWIVIRDGEYAEIDVTGDGVNDIGEWEVIETLIREVLS